MGNTTSNITSLNILKLKKDTPAHKAGILPFINTITHINDVPASLDIIKNINNLWSKQSIKFTIRDIRQTEDDARIIEIPKKEERQTLGMSVTMNDTNFNLCFCVLSVDNNTPAFDAGLIVNQDYIIGIENVSLKDEDDFFAHLYKNANQKVNLIVCNVGMLNMRIVELVPQKDVLLGCELGSGMLYKLPENPLHFDFDCNTTRFKEINHDMSDGNTAKDIGINAVEDVMKNTTEDTNKKVSNDTTVETTHTEVSNDITTDFNNSTNTKVTNDTTVEITHTEVSKDTTVEITNTEVSNDTTVEITHTEVSNDLTTDFNNSTNKKVTNDTTVEITHTEVSKDMNTNVTKDNNTIIDNDNSTNVMQDEILSILKDKSPSTIEQNNRNVTQQNMCDITTQSKQEKDAQIESQSKQKNEITVNGNSSYPSDANTHTNNTNNSVNLNNRNVVINNDDVIQAKGCRNDTEYETSEDDMNTQQSKLQTLNSNTINNMYDEQIAHIKEQNTELSDETKQEYIKPETIDNIAFKDEIKGCQNVNELCQKVNNITVEESSESDENYRCYEINNNNEKHLEIAQTMLKINESKKQKMKENDELMYNIRCDTVNNKGYEDITNTMYNENCETLNSTKCNATNNKEDQTHYSNNEACQIERSVPNHESERNVFYNQKEYENSDKKDNEPESSIRQNHAVTEEQSNSTVNQELINILSQDDEDCAFEELVDSEPQQNHAQKTPQYVMQGNREISLSDELPENNNNENGLSPSQSDPGAFDVKKFDDLRNTML